MEENTEQFNFEEKLHTMRESGDKRMKIIALYWSYKGWRFQNALQWNKALRRELRASGELLGYSSQQITDTMAFCDKEFEIWTIETLSKQIENVCL